MPCTSGRCLADGVGRRDARRSSRAARCATARPRRADTPRIGAGMIIIGLGLREQLPPLARPPDRPRLRLAPPTSALARQGMAPRRASPSCASNEVRCAHERRGGLGLSRPTRGMANEWQPAYAARVPAGPVGSSASPTRSATRTSRGRDTGDNCPASPTPSPRRRRGTTPRSRRNASSGRSRGVTLPRVMQTRQSARRPSGRPANRTRAAGRRRTGRRRRPISSS